MPQHSLRAEDSVKRAPELRVTVADEERTGLARASRSRARFWVCWMTHRTTQQPALCQLEVERGHGCGESRVDTVVPAPHHRPDMWPGVNHPGGLVHLSGDGDHDRKHDGDLGGLDAPCC